MKYREIIKKSLLELQQELDSWSDPTWESGVDGEGCLHDLPTIASGIGAFIKKCAVFQKDYELIGLCTTIIDKGAELEDQSGKNWEEYQDQLKLDYWKTKEYNATDIGKLLMIGSGAKANLFLESKGYQVRQNKGWVATDKANGLCEQKGVEEGKKPYIRWKQEIIDHLLNSCGLQLSLEDLIHEQGRIGNSEKVSGLLSNFFK